MLSLILAAATALAVAAFAKTRRNRSFVFWTLGTFAAFLVAEIPLRMMLAGSDASAVAKTLTVTLVIAAVAFLLAIGSSRKVTSPGAAR